MIAYVLLAESVYDQGIFGVFSTEKAAFAHAMALLENPRNDLHHSFRIEPHIVGEGREFGSPLEGWEYDWEQREGIKPVRAGRLKTLSARGETLESYIQIMDKPQ